VIVLIKCYLLSLLLFINFHCLLTVALLMHYLLNVCILQYFVCFNTYFLLPECTQIFTDNFGVFQIDIDEDYQLESFGTVYRILFHEVAGYLLWCWWIDFFVVSFDIDSTVGIYECRFSGSCFLGLNVCVDTVCMDSCGIFQLSQRNCFALLTELEDFLTNMLACCILH